MQPLQKHNLKTLQMKFVISIILIALLSYATGLFAALPWYSFVFCAFIVAVAIPQHPLKSLMAGFIALFLLWGLMALWMDMKNQHILSTKVAALLKLGTNYSLLIILTAFIGGLLGGLAALSGSFLSKRNINN